MTYTAYTYDLSIRNVRPSVAGLSALQRVLNAQFTSLATSFASLPTVAEFDQIKNIDSVTISNTQWGYLGALDQALSTTDSPTFAGIVVDYTISAENEFGLIGLSGGATVSTGANILLYGSTHATLAGDMFFRSDTSSFLWRDHSASTTYHYGDATFDGGVLHVDSTNDRVGIGTDSPESELEVSGAVGATSITVSAPTGENSRLVFQDNAQEFWSIGSVGSNGDFTFYDPGSATTPVTIESGAPGNTLTVDSAGRIGIGTGGPNTKLHVVDGASGATGYGFFDAVTVESNTSNGINFLTPDAYASGIVWGTPSDTRGASLSWQFSTKQLQIRADNADGEIAFYSGNTERARLDSAGNLGIGTTEPSADLEVSGAAAQAVRLSNTTAAISASDVIGSIDFYTADVTATAGVGASIKAIAGGGFDGTAQKMELGFFTSSVAADLPGVERVRIDDTGQVGIGTSSPAVALHVAGETKTDPVTVANLPSASTVGAGARSFVSDATATTFASIVAGTGSNNVPVYSDGTNWRIG